jgi:hypothetical protein
MEAPVIKNAKVIGRNISYETYSRQGDGVGRGHPDYSVSRSALAEIAVCPKRWRDGVDDDDSTNATEWGSLIDVLLMAPQRFDSLYAVAPAEYRDEKKGEMKKWNWNATVCKQWREDQGDRIVIKSELLKKAQTAMAALMADDDLKSLIACSKFQVMVVGEWHDADTGLIIPIRSLLDIVPDKEHPIWCRDLCDFKTARDGNPDFWARVVDGCAYDIQAMLSTDLYVAATGEDRTDWIFPVQENVHPYHVVKPLPALTSEFQVYGRAKYQSALRLYARCLAKNHWPSYPTGKRMVIGPRQYIGPDSLFKYREQGGGLADRYEAPPEKPQPEVEPDCDLTP